MPNPYPQSIVRAAADLYRSGKNVREVGELLAIPHGSVCAILKRGNVAMRPIHQRNLNLDDAAIVARYRAGESELALARAFGVQRWTIRRRLWDAGITPRNGSEANTIRFARSTPEELSAITEAAHKARREKGATEQELELRAYIRAAKMSVVGAYEEDLSEELLRRGYATFPQLAVRSYNIDIAILHPRRIAVEVHNARHHPSYRQEARRRINTLLGVEWIVLYVWVHTKNKFSVQEAADAVERVARKTTTENYFVARVPQDKPDEAICLSEPL